MVSSPPAMASTVRVLARALEGASRSRAIRASFIAPQSIAARFLMSEHEQITVKEYASIFRLHIQTVYTAIRYNRLPHHVIRVGRAIRISVPRESINERKTA